LLTNPAKVEVTPASTTVEAIDQSLYYVDKQDKSKLLLHLLQDDRIVNALIFTRTKHGADKVVKFLHHAHITAAAIHGNKSQNARQNALSNFKNGKTRVLVATDIAARGIDIDELSHVINYELPNVPETYVHRIGRTGRAGNSGIAISFCDADERDELRDIQKLIGKSVPVVAEHPFPLNISAAVRQAPQPAARQGGQGGNRQRSGGSGGRNPVRSYGNRR
jgi:ATP-dependent RNA helicase RhlE